MLATKAAVPERMSTWLSTPAWCPAEWRPDHPILQRRAAAPFMRYRAHGRTIGEARREQPAQGSALQGLLQTRHEVPHRPVAFDAAFSAALATSSFSGGPREQRDELRLATRLLEQDPVRVEVEIRYRKKDSASRPAARTARSLAGC